MIKGPDPRQSAGGKVMAVQQREIAVAKYYSNPNICKGCGSIIEIKEMEKVHSVKHRKFHNQSCAAIYNNAHRILKIKEKMDKRRLCPDCGQIKIDDRSDVCQQCYRILNGKLNSLGKLTKAEIFNKRTNYQSARSSIRAWAQEVYMKSDKPKCCHVCKYTLHFDVCHIKKVSEFPDDALISEINAIDNLIALCPNHHWEFDHNLLKL